MNLVNEIFGTLKMFLEDVHIGLEFDAVQCLCTLAEYLPAALADFPRHKDFCKNPIDHGKRELVTDFGKGPHGELEKQSNCCDSANQDGSFDIALIEHLHILDENRTDGKTHENGFFDAQAVQHTNDFLANAFQ